MGTWDGERFREAVKHRCWNLQEFSVNTGIPYSVVRSYSRGATHPTPARLVQIAEALDVRTTDLAPLSKRPTLHELRWHAGMTIAQLAGEVRYSVSNTSSVLHGAVPMTEPARWSKALGATEEIVTAAWAESKKQAKKASNA